MYGEDSFFTLSQTGQIGLLLLSCALSLAMIGAIYWLARKLPRLAALGVAIAGFWAFDWLSPQVYYVFYMTQFDGLPVQNVIQYPKSPVEILRLVTFQDEATLSAHGRGLLAWALIAVALLRSRADARRPDMAADPD